MPPEHHHAAHHTHDADPDAEAALAELLDLDAVALRESWEQIHAAVGAATAGSPVRRVLDLGSGTGATGTVALARRFERAEVIAVDASTTMLERLQTNADAAGVGDRVRAVEADLDHGWPVAGPFDVVWASMSMHHVADPDRVLREIAAALAPGGVVVLVEFDEPISFLAGDAGVRAEELAQRAVRHEHATALPDLGSQWAPRLVAAGLTVESERTVTIDLAEPDDDSTQRYARIWLRRLAAGGGADLAPDVTDTLLALADADTPLVLHVRGERTVTIARR